jgi:hypothetical protein
VCFSKQHKITVPAVNFPGNNLYISIDSQEAFQTSIFVYRDVISLKRIYNFLCSMLVYAPFALCFITLHSVFMHFLKLTY